MSVQLESLELRPKEHLSVPRLHNVLLIWYGDLLLLASYERSTNGPICAISWNALSAVQSVLPIHWEQRGTFCVSGVGAHHWLVRFPRSNSIFFPLYSFFVVGTRKAQDQEQEGCLKPGGVRACKGVGG